MSFKQRFVGTLSLVSGILGILAALGGCASLDAQAVGESHRLENAPYYVDLVQPSPEPGSCAIVFAPALDPELARTFGYEGRAGEFQPLLGALDARLRSRQGCVREAPRTPTAEPSPRVYVGSAEGDYAPPGVEALRVPGDRFAPMVLHVERPGSAWQQEAAALVAESGEPYGIVVQLGVSQYIKGYSGVFSKEVQLGTGYSRPLRFLTAEDKPVEVLHLTGVLVDQHGRPVRAGAEGIVARDTPFLAQTVDASRLFDEEELQRVLTQERRRDLPGAPLAIDVALDNLLAGLTRAEVRVPAR